MTADEARRIDDEVQAEVLAQWDADKSEAGDFGDLLLLLLMFVLTVTLVASIAVAWYVTKRDGFGWALLLVGACVVVGYACLFRKQPADGAL